MGDGNELMVYIVISMAIIFMLWKVGWVAKKEYKLRKELEERTEKDTMMFKPELANVIFRKACALRGAKIANWRPVYKDYSALLKREKRIVAKIYPVEGKPFLLTMGEIIEAQKYTWDEVNNLISIKERKT